MFEIKVIASGSNGNCTLIKTSDGENILLDVGVGIRQINKATNYEPIDYALITHEHSDHADKITIKTLLERGTEICMTAGTQEALKLQNRHNLVTFRANNLIITQGCFAKFRLNVIDVEHDAAEPVAFNVSELGGDEDKIMYLTDAGNIPDFGNDDFTKIMIETNYSTLALEKNSIDESAKRRIAKCHLSIEKVVNHFEKHKYERLQEIHLMHISARHGDGEQFIHIDNLFRHEALLTVWRHVIRN